MFKSLLRGFRQLAFTILVLFAGVCVIEVSARGHRLYEKLRNSAAQADCSSSPCPVCYRSLAPLTKLVGRHGETGKTVEFTTNTLGFRGPEVQIPKPSGVFRIICLGDDRTLASDVDESEAFVAQLQQQLGTRQPVEVINAGTPGYCPLLCLVQLKHRMLGLQPDVVILNLHASDVDDDQLCRPFARFDANGLPEAVVHPASPSDRSSCWKQIEGEFCLIEMMRRHAGGYLADEMFRSPRRQATASDESPAGKTDRLGSDIPTHIRQTLDPIIQLQSLCEKLGGRFLLAILPSPGHRPADHERFRRSGSGGADEFAQAATLFARDLNIPLIDPAVELEKRSSSEDLFLTADGNLSPAGHRLYGELLADAVAMLVELDRSESDSPVRPVSHNPFESSPESVVAPTSAAPLPLLRRRPRLGGSTDSANVE